MGELGALFNPGMRHELAERQAKAARREEEGNARDGDLRIDLESGVAVINVVGADTEESTTETSHTETAASETAAAEDPSTDHAHAEVSSPDVATAGPAQGRPAASQLKPRGKRGLSHSAR